MQSTSFTDLARHLAQRYAILLLVWSGLLLASLAWNVRMELNETINSAALIARTTIQKDVVFHKWVALHGGVYVSPTDQTPANPYLVAPNRDIVTAQNHPLTLMNPAYALRELQGIEGQSAISTNHITSLKPINPSNAADAWETAALLRFGTGVNEVSEVVQAGDGGQMRMMQALITKEECLTCHAFQGYASGDILGGISSTVALAPYLADERNRVVLPLLSHSVIWLFGLIGGGISFKREQKLLNKQAQSEVELREREDLFRNYFELGQLGMCITSPDHQWLRVNTRLCNMLGYTESELTQSKWTTLTHPEDLETDLLLFNRLIAGDIEHYDLDKRFITKNGTTVFTHLAVTCQRQPDGSVQRVIASLDDITERKKIEIEIKSLALYDPLTGLANRRLMTERMEHTLALARRSGDLAVICMLDLDGFKQVNDQLGHKAGDLLLIEVAKRLQKNLRQTDTASRFGGDEFSLLLSGFKSIDECEISLQRILASLAAAYQVNGQVAHVSASIGATIFPNDGGTADLLLRHADESMYEAKHAGKNCYRLFNPSHRNQQLSNLATLKKIGKALKTGEFTLYYQPQVDCRQAEVVGMEALVRWNHPILGLLAPSEFIPLLENDDLIVELGDWVLNEALKQQLVWRNAGFDLSVSVNISARQLFQQRFIDRLTELQGLYGTHAMSHLTIEIVETTALDDIDRVTDTLRQCHDMGIRLAIDDFGTGFSSLAHLKQLRVDELKIDKGFVCGMLQNPDDLAIVRGVIGLAESFRHKLVAEGVESIAHILMLLSLRCDVAQGFVIAHPMPGSKTMAWLKSFEPDPQWHPLT